MEDLYSVVQKPEENKVKEEKRGTNIPLKTPEEANCEEEINKALEDLEKGDKKTFMNLSKAQKTELIFNWKKTWQEK